jgi:hypothetical protein
MRDEYVGAMNGKNDEEEGPAYDQQVVQHDSLAPSGR